jgi:hypothetical protein
VSRNRLILDEDIVPKKENTTKSFVLRVDAATMDAIEKWAADEFRSTNGQLQWIINEALRKSGRLKKSNRKEKEGEESDD